MVELWATGTCWYQGQSEGEAAVRTWKRKALAVLGVGLTVLMYTKAGLVISAFLLVVIVVAAALNRPEDRPPRGL